MMNAERLIVLSLLSIDSICLIVIWFWSLKKVVYINSGFKYWKHNLLTGEMAEQPERKKERISKGR